MIALLQILALVLGLGGGVHTMGANPTGNAPHNIGPWFSTVSHGVHTEGQHARTSVGSTCGC